MGTGNKNTNTPRVVRAGAKTSKKHRMKKPLSPVARFTKGFFGIIGKIILTTFLVMVITGCIVGTALTIYVMEFIDSEATIDLNNLDMNYTAIVYAKDKDGKDVEVKRLNQKENRIWVDFKEIPQDLKDAVVYTEDERFYTHSGVDFKRTIYAFVQLMLGEEGGGGGSTIAQQLIKNINGNISHSQRTVDVKIQEIITAMNLDRHYEKDTILESYLNYIALDNNINGVQTGAKYYFNKDVSELTLNECAAIAVISKSPSSYNPIKHPEKNKKRRQYAFDKMLEHGAITQAEYDEVYDQELVLAETNTVNADGATTKEYQSWFVDSLINEVVADLCAKYNYNEDYATQLLFTSGYSIESTMEIETQKILEDYFADPNNFIDKNKKKDNLPQAYMNIMDYNGNIVATVGGKGKKEGDRLLNRAMVSERPAGSTMKPLAVYTPAFEHDIVNWSTVMEDSPVQKVKDEKTGAERDWPNNYNKKYEGMITLIDALKVSKNTIPVRIVNTLTPQVSFDYVYNQLHLKTLRPTGTHNDVGLASMALGDGGTTIRDLTAAYQIFGNGGYYIEPKMYTKVKDADGKVILDTTNRKKTQVMSPETAYIMNKGLWNVVNNQADPAHRGSGGAAKMTDWEVVGKTGTSNDRKDLLFMGCTPYYVAGIRYGLDDNKVIDNEGLSQITVWKNVMEKVHKGKPPAKFQLNSEGIVEYEYCTASGMLAHSGCEKKQVGYYKLAGNIPSTCTVHAPIGGFASSSSDATSSGEMTSSGLPAPSSSSSAASSSSSQAEE